MRATSSFIPHPFVMKVGFLYSRIRKEEKLLISEFQERGVDLDLIDVRHCHFNLADREPWTKYDVIMERCVSHTRALAALQILEVWDVPTVNTAHVAQVCGDKLATSAALFHHDVPSPEVRVAFTEEAGLAAIEEMGYPVVLKPATGSWGRLLSKVNDREAAESLLEHKATLGSVHHGIFYIQEYVDKKEGSDIRTFVVDDVTICGILRKSPHWITNTARGGEASVCEITDQIDAMSRAAAKAVGGGIVAVDLMETQDGKMVVNEVNYTMEFRNSILPTGVNIPGKMVDYVLKVGSGS